MKQIIIFLIIASFGFPHYAQVGINNTDPKASLDITATNQANPSNTDGLLIPRIDAFPATPPTATQQGMLVYLTTTSGTNNSGYYYWDNGSSTWKAMLGTSDADFFETGGTPPNDINDNIYTHGKVNIGTTDFSSSTTLNINTSEFTGAFIKNNNTSSPIGLALSLPADNATIKTGLSVTLSGINSNVYISSGIKTNFSTTGSNNSFDGIQQNFSGNSTNGIIAGLNNNFFSNSSYKFIIGVSNIIDSEGIGEHIGVSNSLGGIASGKQKGNETFIDNSGNGYHYGNYNILSGTGSGNKYGTYNLIDTSANGTHYGIYSDVLSPTGYAGYFLGRVSIGTTTSNNYILPSTRGNNGQVMRTDGAGNLSWVTPTQSDADWFGEGTTSAPNNINDNIFTNGFVGIGDNTPDNILDVEYTGNIDNGVSILYNNTDDSGPTVALNLTGENLAGATSNITGAYIQVKNSIGTDKTKAIYAFNTASGNTNSGLSAVANGAGQNNYGNSGTANGASQNNYGGFFKANSTIGKNYGVTGYAYGSTTNWAGYFGDFKTIPDVGSGNVYIQDLLQVDGTLKFTNGANNNYILKSDASGNATWVNPIAIFTDTNTQNTLDQAYDQGSAGAGRTINADNGAVRIAGTDGFQVTGTFNSGATIGTPGAGTRMFFNPKKAAFRAGGVSGTQWDNANVGTSSFAVGFDNIASGSNSVAMGSYNETSGNSSIASGSYTTASGNYSFAAGYGTIASGSSSIALGGYSKATGNNSSAFGSFSEALGDNSIAMGSYSKAFSFSEIALGIYPTPYTPSSTTVFNSSDRLFVIGNGIDSANKSNALTIYKNGLMNINDSYNMPLTDGTTNQIMQTDGAGQVSFVDPTSLQDADWHETGGTAPNSINDNIYTYGNIGIGTTAISNASLHISRNSSSSNPQLNLTEIQADDGTRINFTNSVETTNKWTLYARSDNTSTSNYFNVYNTVGGNIITVKGEGKVGINRTPTTNALEVNGQASKSSAGSWIGNSDRRLKKDIVKIEGKIALDKIMKMKGVTYLWNDTQTGINRPTNKQYGFIAQELMQVFPEKVTMDDLGFYQTAYGDYDPIFVEAIKELKQEVDILEEKNQQLKKQLKKYEGLEARLSALEKTRNISVND